MTFWIIFSFLKMFKARLRLQLTISQHWLQYWFGAEHASSYHLNKWWSSFMTLVCVNRSELVKRYCYVQPSVQFICCVIYLLVSGVKTTNNNFYISWKQLFHCRIDSRFVPNHWETSLQSNAVSHWLGANLHSTLNCTTFDTLKPDQNGCHFIDGIFKWIYFD